LKLQFYFGDHKISKGLLINSFMKLYFKCIFAVVLMYSSVKVFCEPQPAQLLEDLQGNGTKDDADAQFHLGELYFAGWGVRTIEN
jgi:hypothetical protein